MLEHSVLEGLHPMQRTNAGALTKRLDPLERTPCWRGEQCDEKGLAFHSLFSCITQSEVWGKRSQKSREWRSKVEPGKKEGVRGGVLVLVLCFVLFSHNPILFLIFYKLNYSSPSWLSPAGDSEWWMISFSSSHPVSFFILFPSPALLRYGRDRAA